MPSLFGSARKLSIPPVALVTGGFLLIHRAARMVNGNLGLAKIPRIT
ncbi:hypothetical protein [Agrobacterium vitis]|nr:hypothetical protein [Agrobacterium vitis]NSZ17283.1 hypothetical protein [Agrobacterium vitis]QZO02998.1 hypothetical protein K4831_11095 [Agrobacterium vitis]UJL88122.1 hypothetical protein AVF2S5_09435 [Agrobacterium vitis]